MPIIEESWMKFKKKNKILKTEVKSLKESIKVLNDQRVKNDCIISGIVTPKDQSACLKLTSDVGIEVQLSSIEDAYFIKKKRNEPADSNNFGKRCWLLNLTQRNRKMCLCQEKSPQFLYIIF